MGSYTWKDSGEYTSSTTNEFIKSWNLDTIYNNYISKNIPRYSKISKVTFSVDAKQNLSLSSGSIGAYFAYYENDITGDDVFVCLPDQGNAVKKSYKTFSNEVTSYFVLDGSSCGRAQGFQPYGILRYLCITAHSTVIRKHSFKNISLKFDYNDQYTISTSVSPSGSGTVSGGGTKTAGTTITLTANPATGYEFKQWSDGNTSNPRSVTVTGNATYTAQFTENKYTIAFNGNGNTGGSMSSLTNVGYDDSKTLTANVFTKTGYTFNGWNTKADGSGTSYADKASVSKLSATNGATVTLYAKWKANSYTINFNANGGSGSMSNLTMTYDTAQNLTANSFTRTGYDFLGWSTSNTATTATYADKASVKNLATSGTVTLYAVWKVKICTITFKNVDDSVVSTKTLNSGATLGTAFQELPTVSRNGYTFGGWIPCAPAIKTDGSILDSYQYNGSSSFYTLDKKYKSYTDKLSVHIEAYASNWDDMASNDAQIISCTESGGWGIGEYAAGAEVYAGGYKGIDLGFSSLSDKNWHTFDIVFSSGTFEAYVDGTKKGTQTTNETAISYNSDNTIFVGAESYKNASTPEGKYFKGFISNVFIANQGTKLQIATTSTVVNSNIDYYPIWRKSTTFTATFKNHDGTVLQTVDVEHGDIPNYTGSTPTKPSTVEYSYSFSGWSPPIGAITSDTPYVAQFTATKRKYTISASATNGTVSGGGTYEYGTSVILTVTPDNGYKFEKWSDGNTQNPRTITVTGNATYEAQIRRLVLKFKSVKIYYPTEANIASPDNPLVANEKAQIVVRIALE